MALRGRRLKKGQPKDGGDAKTADGPKLAIALATEGVGSEQFWLDEIEKSEKRIKKEIPAWQANLRRYRDEQAAGATSAGFEARVNVDYYQIESKREQLFFRTPDLQVTHRREEFRQSAPMVRAVMNDLLGEDNIDVKGSFDEAIFDVLCPAGIGAVKTGYDRTQVDVKIPTNRVEPSPDGLTQVSVMVPGKDGVMEPEFAIVPKTIWDEFYAEAIDPSNLRIPVSFRSTRAVKAPWLGHAFRPDPATLSRAYDVEAGEGDNAKDLALYGTADSEFVEEGGAGYGVELFYKASVYDPTEKNPERVRRLVIVATKNGKKRVVVNENSQDQKFDETTGAFLGGVRGLPIDILSLRTVRGTAYPASDARVTRGLVDELNKGRTQMIQQRDDARPLRGFDKTRVRGETLKAIEQAPANSLVGFDGDPREQVVELAQARYSEQNFTFNDVLQQDINRSWAQGSNSQAVRESGSRTATEISSIDQSTQNRLAAERERVLRFYIRIAYKVLGLVQLFADETRTVAILGPQKEQVLKTWTKSDVQGEFAFSLRPNSAMRIDAAEMREQQLRFNNLTANNQYFNQEENARRLAEAWGMDPNDLVVKPPPPKEEKPKISISIKGDDLNPFAPQYVNVLAVLAHEGIQGLLPPGPQPPAPGLPPAAAPEPIAANRGIPPVDQHDADLTGARTGPPPM